MREKASCILKTWMKITPLVFKWIPCDMKMKIKKKIMLVFSISFKIEEGGVKTIQYKKHGVYSYISTMFVATVHNFSRVGEGQVLVSA